MESSLPTMAKMAVVLVIAVFGGRWAAMALRRGNDRQPTKTAWKDRRHESVQSEPDAFDVEQWLGGIGMGAYLELFRANDLQEPTVLAGLTELDLKDIGVEPLGHRKKIITACSALLRPSSAASSPQNSWAKGALTCGLLSVFFYQYGVVPFAGVVLSGVAMVHDRREGIMRLESIVALVLNAVYLIVHLRVRGHL